MPPGSTLSLEQTDLDKDVWQSFNYYMFGVVPAMDFFSTEVNQVACLRASIVGQRTCIAAHYHDIREMLAEDKGKPANLVSLSEVLGFMKLATADQIDKFVSKKPLYVCTMGPNGCLYTPTGMVLGEVVHNKMDFIGVRKSVLVKGGKDAELLTDFISVKDAQDKTIMSNVVAKLSDPALRAAEAPAPANGAASAPVVPAIEAASSAPAVPANEGAALAALPLGALE